MGSDPPVIVAIPDCDDTGALRRPRNDETLWTLDGETMGSTWSVRFFAPPRDKDSIFLSAIEAELEIVVAQMSHWSPASDLSIFNRSPAGRWQILPPEFFHVLDFSLEVARQSSGAFDPTLGPIVNAWGFGPTTRTPRPPHPNVLSAIEDRCGWTNIHLDRATRSARHSGNPGLDFSAIAKGFAVDRVAQRLQALGIVSYLVEIGGELRASGVKPGSEPWWVAIEPPGVAIENFPQIRIALSGWSIATSGCYRRFFECDGRQWTHTIHPQTQSPVSPELLSVSVVHKDCIAADAYSTALMVLGPANGMKLAEDKGLAALWVVRRNGKVSLRFTEAFRRMTE